LIALIIVFLSESFRQQRRDVVSFGDILAGRRAAGQGMLLLCHSCCFMLGHLNGGTLQNVTGISVTNY
jgi:hypothetical protein